MTKTWLHRGHVEREGGRERTTERGGETEIETEKERERKRKRGREREGGCDFTLLCQMQGVKL